jgi:acetylornithine deacetylase/succinyl-diaminopimelate desuccinylase-like protein
VKTSSQEARLLGRREFIGNAVSAAVILGAAPMGQAAALRAKSDKAAVLAQIPNMHAENLRRLQDWITLPSIAAEDLNYPQGAEYLVRLLKEVGFTQVQIIPTSGKPGVFGLFNAQARTTVCVYVMYDVKQYVSKEWSSPPLEGRLVHRDLLGTVCVGRGALNQKGPQSSFLGAVAAFARAGRRLPVNLVLIGEGEEEISSPHFGEVTGRPGVFEHLKKCVGVLLPEASQEADGNIELQLGAKGIVEVELISSGEGWGRGSDKDLHSSLEAQVDSPVWHLVEALTTLVEKDGHTPAVKDFFERVKPLSPAQTQMITSYAARVSEEGVKNELGVHRWVHDLSWQDSLLRLYSQPTINIEGLLGGYTGPGGKTVLPHRATAKIDMRLVPDMTAADTFAKLKAHLSKREFGDIEVNMLGGYDPTQTDPESRIVKAALNTYRSLGYSPQVLPRSTGSWPGYLFTNPPLSLPACPFGLGHGGGAHAPDEYYVIDSVNPKVQGLDGSVRSFVEYLYELA